MARARSLTLVVAATALTLAACGGGSGAEGGASSTAPLGPDRWMEDVYGSKTSTTLGQMVIPGTHDSGSFGIDVDQPCDLKAAAGTSVAITALGSRNACAAAGMYRAQDQNLTDQLAAGIRYLDLRVSVPTGDVVTGGQAAPSNPSSVPFVLEHEYVSTPLNGALDQILAFAASHPKEQVILDLQHVDLPKDADTAYYYGALASLFKSYAPSGARPVCATAWSSDTMKATPETLATGVTLRQAWDAQKNLVVLVPDNTLAADTCYYPRSNAIISEWPNTEDPAKSVQVNADELAQRQQRLAAQPQQCSNGGKNVGQGDNWCGFFVNQMQLTFQPLTFVGCIENTKPECSLYAYSQKVNNQVGPQIQTWRTGAGLPVNIVIVDYFEDSSPSYTQTLIDVNRQIVSGASGSASPAASKSS